MLAPRTFFSAVGGEKMSYRGERVGVGEMFAELLAHGSGRLDAAIELQHAFSDAKIILWYGGVPVIDEVFAIGKFLRDFAANPAAASRGLGALATVMAEAQADRAQFEAVCGLASLQTDSGPRLTAEQQDAPKATTKGPAPGTIDRYGESDRARFPEIEALMKAGDSLTAATEKLGASLEGPATPASKAKRLHNLFKKLKAAN